MSTITSLSQGPAPRIKKLLAAVLGVLLIASSSTAMARRDRQQDAPVVIFADSGFSGRAQALGPGDYDTDALTIGNDTLSSIHVAPGYRVILFKNSHFSGKSRSITSDTADLGDFNDDTSSIRVQRESESGRNERQSQVVIYSNTNYKGRAQQLGNGNYDLGDLSIGNDKLSSLRVSRGCRVTLFSDEHFSGEAMVIQSDTPSLARFNDATSSIRVECR